MPIDTSERCTPVPPISMKLITALQVLCMILSEPAATACMPGETPIEIMSISTPLAAKNPFLVATIPGQTVAVGETWPNETLVADSAGSTPDAIACSATTAGKATLSQARMNFSPAILLASPPWRYTLCEPAMRAQVRLRKFGTAIMIRVQLIDRGLASCTHTGSVVWQPPPPSS